MLNTDAAQEMAQRLNALLDIPVELLLGTPGEPSARTRDLLDVDPYLVIHARQVMAAALHTRRGNPVAVPILATMPALDQDDLTHAA
ncbi:hypothetical protein [Streptodolium elevatio]|uniref:Uncharacterized protein n=1 Tax=Streptodolium elevatio TaxID=3157996 RepID=A0ABV3DTD0_9ACTN